MSAPASAAVVDSLVLDDSAEPTTVSTDPLGHSLLPSPPPLSPVSSNNSRQGHHTPTTTNSATAAVLTNLFGRQQHHAQSPCWGQFACSHQRIKGTLFASSTAVLFYSNLLGFERRLVLPYRQVQHLELYRTTSIRLLMVDGEAYVFRSFAAEERHHVLRLLKGLHNIVQSQRRSSRTTISVAGSDQGQPQAPLPLTTSVSSPPSTLRERIGSAPARSVPRGLTSSTSTAAASPPDSGSRRRAVSDSLVQQQLQTRQWLPRGASEASLASLAEEQEQDLVVASDTNNHGNLQHAASLPSFTALSDRPINDNDAPLYQAWRAAQSALLDPPLRHVGIDSLVLPLSLDAYFDLFLADDAPHSLDRFQREFVKDLDVVMTPWKKLSPRNRENGNSSTTTTATPTTYTRTLTFTHPLTNRALGPTSAETTRRAKLTRYGRFGMCLEHTTTVQGTPAADSFKVVDQWCIQANSNNGQPQVHVSARYGTRFTQRTWFKSLIESSIQSETRSWFAGYVRLLQQQSTSAAATAVDETRASAANLAAATTSTTVQPPSGALLVEKEERRRLLWYARMGLVLLVLIFIVLVLQLFLLRDMTRLLKSQQQQQLTPGALAQDANAGLLFPQQGLQSDSPDSLILESSCEAAPVATNKNPRNMMR